MALSGAFTPLEAMPKWIQLFRVPRATVLVRGSGLEVVCPALSPS